MNPDDKSDVLTLNACELYETVFLKFNTAEESNEDQCFVLFFPDWSK